MLQKTNVKVFQLHVPNAAIMVNNADWLLELNYVDFLEIGVHFSVNKMLTPSASKSEWRKGLLFEFNYMLMQAYDFLVLNRKYGCKLQCGGDDQWSNILAGADLIRRKEGQAAYALTFELLTTSEGKKMGKTQKGAIWLDENKTSPYDFYQYFRNVDDADVNKCLRFLTYLDLDTINELTKYQDERINKAKEILAYEVTKIVHGEEKALQARQQARAAFSGDEDNMPKMKLTTDSNLIIDILVSLNLTKPKRPRDQSKVSLTIDGQRVKTIDDEITPEQRQNGFTLHKGKKTRIKVIS